MPLQHKNIILVQRFYDDFFCFIQLQFVQVSEIILEVFTNFIYSVIILSELNKRRDILENII